MTHVNFVVDCSGSMGATASTYKQMGKTLTVARWETMRYLVSSMLDTIVSERNGTDTFSIIEFETDAHPIVKNIPIPAKRFQTSSQFERVMDDLSEYMSDKTPQGLSHPLFLNRGGTNIGEALKVTEAQTPANTPTLTLLFTDMWDLDGSYIYNALMTPCGKNSCLDALTLNGPLIVIAICDHHQLSMCKKGCRGVEEKVNQHFGKNVTGKSFTCIADTLDDDSFYNGIKDLL